MHYFCEATPGNVSRLFQPLAIVFSVFVRPSTPRGTQMPHAIPRPCLFFFFLRLLPGVCRPCASCFAYSARTGVVKFACVYRSRSHGPTSDASGMRNLSKCAVFSFQMCPPGVVPYTNATPCINHARYIFFSVSFQRNVC